MKPIELTKTKKKEILKLIKFKYGYAMKYVEGITLYDALKIITESKDYNIIRKQLIESFTCLWKNGYIHGDSHMKNILVYTSSSDLIPRIKIIDFGFSTSFSVLLSLYLALSLFLLFRYF